MKKTSILLIFVFFITLVNVCSTDLYFDFSNAKINSSSNSATSATFNYPWGNGLNENLFINKTALYSTSALSKGNKIILNDGKIIYIQCSALGQTAFSYASCFDNNNNKGNLTLKSSYISALPMTTGGGDGATAGLLFYILDNPMDFSNSLIYGKCVNRTKTPTKEIPVVVLYNSSYMPQFVIGYNGFTYELQTYGNKWGTYYTDHVADRSYFGDVQNTQGCQGLTTNGLLYNLTRYNSNATRKANLQNIYAVGLLLSPTLYTDTDFSYNISALNFSGILYIANNSLPNFTYSYQKNVCVNTSTNTNNFNFSYTCVDPDGDTCYFGSQQVTANEIVEQDDFDSGTWVTIQPTAFNSFNQAFSAKGYDLFTWSAEFANYLLSLVHPSTAYNNFITVDQSLLDSGRYSSDCTIANNGISLTKVNGYDFQGNMLINNGCNSPMNISLPDFNYNVLQRTFSISFLLSNLSQFGSDYHESLIRYRDSGLNNILNFTVTRNFTSKNTSFYTNGVLITKNTTNADLYRLRIFTNDTAKTYVYVIQTSNGSMDGFNDLYKSPVLPQNWNNIKFLNLWTFYGSGAAYDDIYLFGIREKFDWSTSFPINSMNIANGYTEYQVYVTDSAHKDYGQYNTYPITLSVSSKYCGSGLYTLDNPPVNDAQRGSVPGFLFLLRAIVSMGDPFGVQEIMSNVAWLFYIWLFLMIMLRQSATINYALFKSSLVIFLYSASGIFNAIYLVTSAIFIAFSIAIYIWVPEAAGATE